jgi:heme exporter protein CcmD
MDLSASHTGFVISAYAISAIFLIGLVVQVIARDRRTRAEAEMLERQRAREQP